MENYLQTSHWCVNFKCCMLLFFNIIHFYFDVKVLLTTFHAHTMHPDEHSCHNTTWHITHNSATRRQQSEMRF
jgi:hypothetical protein